MDKYLRSLCENFRSLQCNPEVRKYGLPRELNNGEAVPLAEPDEALDKICMICPIGLFQAEKWECPVCGSDKIESNILMSSKSGVGGPYNAKYFYHCNQCGKQLVSYKKELR